MAAVNAFLIYRTAKSTKLVSAHLQSKSRADKQNAMNIMIVLTTVIFLATTLPYSIQSAFFFGANQPSTLLVYIFSDLSFTYHSLNFIIFFNTNRLFNEEVRILFNECLGLFSKKHLLKSRRVATISGSMTANGSIVGTQKLNNNNNKQTIETDD